MAGDVPADELLNPDRMGMDCYVLVMHDWFPHGSWRRWLAGHDSQKRIEPGSRWPDLNDSFV